MFKKLGKDSHSQSKGYLPLVPSPDEESTLHAIERLQDPEKRLIDEFFWFWPDKTGLFNDEAFDLISKNRVNEVIDIWKKESVSCSITAHNLAVLYHAHALDIEFKSITKPLEKDELETCSLCWKGAYKQWQELLKNEILWSQQVTALIRDLNDPRLTTEIARCIRYSLPKALFQINAQLALRAAEKKDEATCNYHIQLVNEFGCDKKLFNTVIHEAVSPVRERIRILCVTLDKKIEENIELANTLIWEFLLDSKSLLMTIDQLLPESDLVWESTHNEVAKKANESVVAYVNKTEDWKEGVKLLLQAFDIAASKPLRTQIKENLNTSTYNGMQKQESTALKHAETEKKKSVSYTRKSISVKCSLAREGAESNPEIADKLIWQLLLETEPLLQNIRSLTSDNNPLLNSAQDEIADTVLLCEISYRNQTKNWKQCVILLMSAYEIAISESSRTRLKDNIKRLNENLRQEQEYEDLKQATTEGQAFVVSVSGTIATIPAVCVCCLRAAESRQSVSNFWSENQYKHTRSFTFPLCGACKSHQAELWRKRIIWFFLVTTLPVVIAYFWGLNMGHSPYVDFILIGAIISAVVFLLLVPILRLPKLSEKHASRCAAVSLYSIGAGYSTFRFWNHLYAYAFARANNSQVKVENVSKYSRDPYLVRSVYYFRRISWIIALAFIGHSIAFAILNYQWGYSETSRNPSNKPSGYTTTEKNNKPSQLASVTNSGVEIPEYTATEKTEKTQTEAKIETEEKVETEENETRYSLIAQINDGKVQLQKMETDLNQLYAQIKTISFEMESLQTTMKELDQEKDSIGDLEGFLENEGEYKQAINRQKELSKQHNSLQSKYRSGYSVYEKELKRVNEMINQYNKGS
ncbi:MAG: hypothetical protein GY845_30115 [Planctomycetes bacterium]|nr:hypothetical protein [Planctomycetota bacterium]